MDSSDPICAHNLFLIISDRKALSSVNFQTPGVKFFERLGIVKLNCENNSNQIMNLRVIDN